MYGKFLSAFMEIYISNIVWCIYKNGVDDSLQAD